MKRLDFQIIKNTTLLLLFLSLMLGCRKNTNLRNAFISKDYNKVIELGEKLLSKDPTNSEINGVIGRAYNEKGEFKKALPFLLKAKKLAKKDWEYSWTYLELWISYFGIGNIEKATECHRKIGNYGGTKNSKTTLEQREFLIGYHVFYKNWSLLETKHINFYFQDSSKIKNIKKYVNDRELAYVKINYFLESNLPKKIDFFVWKSNKESLKYLKRPLGFSSPKFCVSHNRSNQTVGHEITHNIVYWMDSLRTISKFINEGIAVYFDQTHGNRMNKARKICEKQKINVKDLWTNNIKYKESILYPIAGAFVEKLKNYDESKFIRLCKNQSIREAENIYGKNELTKIMRDFNIEINQQPK